MTSTTRDPAERERLRVVIAEPHPGMRQALEAALARHEGILVVAAVADLPAAGVAVRRHGGAAVVVDDRLLRADRFALGPLSAATTLVAVGMENHPRAVERAHSVGALAYVVKDDAHLLLADALLSLRR